MSFHFESINHLQTENMNKSCTRNDKLIMSKTIFFFHDNFEENKKKQRFNTGIFVTNQDVGVKPIRAHDHLLNIIKT